MPGPLGFRAARGSAPVLPRVCGAWYNARMIQKAARFSAGRRGIKDACARGFAAAVIALCAVVPGCSPPPEGAAEQAPVEAEPPEAAEPEEEAAVPEWTDDDGVVCVLLGYSFNDEEFVRLATEALRERFGLADEGGLVQITVFPDDLGGRISNYRRVIDENAAEGAPGIRGIVLLGAPGGAHNALSAVRDEWDGDPPFSIISLFPQDNVLGQEYACSFVLDSEPAPPADEGGVAPEETEHMRDPDTLSLLLSSVEYAALHTTRPARGDDLMPDVQAIAGERRVSRYIDGETGIACENHFVIEAADRN